MVPDIMTVGQPELVSDRPQVDDSKLQNRSRFDGNRIRLDLMVR